MTDKLCSFCPKGIPDVIIGQKGVRACAKDWDKLVERVPHWDEKTTLTELREQIRKKRIPS